MGVTDGYSKRWLGPPPTQHARALADTSRKAWGDAAEVTSVLCLPDEFKRKKKRENQRPKPFFGAGGLGDY